MASRIPTLPMPAALALRAMPLWLVGEVVSRLAAIAASRHPSLFARLGRHAEAAVLIDPTDLPFVILLRPGDERARVAVHRREAAPARDARIAGPLAALLGIVHGGLDGDALFFSRDLTIEGDTEAVLALRNALDDAEIDLAEEALELLGPVKSLAETPLRALLPVVERLSGVSLSRAGAREAARETAHGEFAA